MVRTSSHTPQTTQKEPERTLLPRGGKGLPVFPPSDLQKHRSPAPVTKFIGFILRAGRAQRRTQKSLLSRKGFSAAGTGVTSGSSLACVSQKARSSAAA